MKNVPDRLTKPGPRTDAGTDLAQRKRAARITEWLELGSAVSIAAVEAMRQRAREQAPTLSPKPASYPDCVTASGEFWPSDELVHIVLGSVRKKQNERSALSAYSAGKADPHPLPPKVADEIDDVLSAPAGEEQMRHFLSERVSDYLATLGRHAASDSTQPLPLTAAGSFFDGILRDLSFRIPLSYSDAAEFDKVLVRDMRRCARDGFQVGKHATLIVLDNNELALQPAAPPVEGREPGWERATVFRP